MMRKITLVLLIAFNVWNFASAKGVSDRDSRDSGGDAVVLNGDGGDDDTSYAFGVALGSDFKQAGVSFDYNSLVQGLRDVMEGRETRMSLDEAIPLIQIALREGMTRLAEENRQKGVDFLAENAGKPGIITTPSGLQYEILSEGTGPKPLSTDTVSVHYEGTLLNGDVFDSSYARNEPTEFALEALIPGWTEGLQLMNVGSSYRFFIPADLAYGEQGYGNIIPANSTLIFEVKLLEILE
jgi:FKBP-type peptidyl-prolyl cis-trans isomerase FkpA